MHIEHNIQTEYQMTNNGKVYTVTETQKKKDLGVYITNDLKWSSHCSKAASKAMQALRLVKKKL